MLEDRRPDSEIRVSQIWSGHKTTENLAGSNGTEAMPNEPLRIFLESTLGLPTALAALAYMFQARHHGLHEHEVRITERARKADGEEKVALSEELKIVRARYNSALLAFISLMGAIFAVVLHYLQRILGLQWPPEGSLAVCSLLLATMAFAFHIFGDLVPAFRHQQIIRRTVTFIVK